MTPSTKPEVRNVCISLLSEEDRATAAGNVYRQEAPLLHRDRATGYASWNFVMSTAAQLYKKSHLKGLQ